MKVQLLSWMRDFSTSHPAGRMRLGALAVLFGLGLVAAFSVSQGHPSVSDDAGVAAGDGGADGAGSQPGGQDAAGADGSGSSEQVAQGALGSASASRTSSSARTQRSGSTPGAVSSPESGPDAGPQSSQSGTSSSGSSSTTSSGPPPDSGLLGDLGGTDSLGNGLPDPNKYVSDVQKDASAQVSSLTSSSTLPSLP